MLDRLKLILFIACLATVSTASGQELDCKVEINAGQVSGTNREVFETLQTAITNYMNDTEFGNAQYSSNERINCRLFLTIKDYSGNSFSGDLQVQSSRPVYNSSYTTTLLNFKDSNLEFDYRENEPLTFTPDHYESQLTAILNFYAYLILAIDSDSFSPDGGNEYYEKAEAVVQQAQSAGAAGWRRFDDNRSRGAILSGFTYPSTSGIRNMLYLYHRKGLDEMALSAAKGRGRITESLNAIKTVYDSNPMSTSLSLFRDSKLDELVNIYSEAPEKERKHVYDLLSPIYPTEMTRLNMIKEGKTE